MLKAKHLLLLWQLNIKIVMPDVIRHPGPFWIPAFAGMTKRMVLCNFSKILEYKCESGFLPLFFRIPETV